MCWFSSKSLATPFFLFGAPALLGINKKANGLIFSKEFTWDKLYTVSYQKSFVIVLFVFKALVTMAPTLNL